MSCIFKTNEQRGLSNQNIERSEIPTNPKLGQAFSDSVGAVNKNGRIELDRRSIEKVLLTTRPF